MLEGNETFTVGLSVSGTTLSVTDTDTGTGTINNDDGAVVTVNNANASEGDKMTFTVTLGEAVQGGLTVTPSFTDGTAVEGTDYDENTTALSFTGTANETKTFTVSTTEDAVMEGDETFTVGLTVSGTSLDITDDDTGTGTINNDDSAIVTVNDANADEGDAITFTVTLDTAVQGGLTVTPGFKDGTAVEGTDYTENTAALTFTGTANETQTFTVSTTEDAVLEDNETFTVGLSVSKAPSGVTASDTGTGTINNDDGATVTVNDANAYEGDDITFTVTLGAAVQGGLTVTPSFTDGTAVEGTDYDENTTALLFTGTANETKTFTVSTTEDTVQESNETFTVGLSVSDTSLDLTDDDTGTGTIYDDDDTPSVNLSVNPTSVGEGDGVTPVTVTAAFSNNTTYGEATTVTVSVGADGDSAASGADYGAVADFTVTIPAGQTSGSAPFTLTPVDDTLIEGDETITVSGTNEILTVTGTSLALTDNDDDGAMAIVLSAKPKSVGEGDGATSVTVTAAFSNANTYATDTTVTVSVGADGDSAASGADYGAVADFTVTIPAGQTSGSAPFTLTPVDDTLVEGDETISVSGTNEILTVTGTSLALTDNDDDGAMVIVLSAKPKSVGEGDGATPVTVTAAFSNANTYATDTTVTVSVGTDGDSAISVTDYGAVADFTVTISAGQASGSASFTLTPVDDTLAEGDETISVSGTNDALTVNGTSVALTDDDSVAAANLVIDLSVDPANVAEDAGSTSVTVTAAFSNATTDATDTTVTVSVGAPGDSAASGTDYGAVTGFTVTIPAGQASSSTTFTLTPVDDTLVESDETISISGASPGRTVGGTSVALTDDDQAAGENLPRVSVGDAEAKEGGILAFRVTLDRAAAGSPVTMKYATEDGTARAGRDYTAVSGTLTFTPGTREQKVYVETLDDALDEGDETFWLRLTRPANAVMADPSGLGTISNEDRLPGAWMTRCGRAAVGHAVDAIVARLHNQQFRTQLTIAGAEVMAPMAGSMDYEGGMESESRSMTGREVLAGTAFMLPSQAGSEPGGSRWTAWGSGAATGFEDSGSEYSITGEAAGGTLGFRCRDGASDHWRGGLAQRVRRHLARWRERTIGHCGEPADQRAPLRGVE